MELQVIYDKDDFSPVCGRAEIQHRGDDGRSSFIECRLSIIHGEKSFREIHDVLRPLFSDSDIEAIEQWHGTVAGQDVVLVVPRIDEVEDSLDWRWCDVAGKEYPEREVMYKWEPRIHARTDRRLVIVKGRRTVVWISDDGPRDVFISYEESSEEVAGRIQGRLQDAGFSCRMKAGARARWREIKNSRVMVVCITERYLKTRNCMEEIWMADLLRGRSGSPEILPLLLEDVEWPPRGRDVDHMVREILSREDVQENVCRLHHDDINDWSGARVEHFIDKVTRLRGVELQVNYFKHDFSPVCGRNEIQYRREDWPFFFIECRLSIAPGERSFREVHDVLRPLFSDSDIKAIEQRQGMVGGEDVVLVVPRIDVENPRDCQWCDEAGKEYPEREVMHDSEQRIDAESYYRLIIVKGRRTVVRIF